MLCYGFFVFLQLFDCYINLSGVKFVSEDLFFMSKKVLNNVM